MADRGQTVRVTGLPTEIELEKLQDKLCIHFQRSKNGGGDVASVTTVKTSPDIALITFEDSRVAQRVIQQAQHFLEVDGKRFNLTVKEHPGHQLQDKIIINLSATVDCSQLSAAKKTLSGLIKKHPDVQMNYSSPRELCTLCGSYSAVQAVLSQLLGQNGLLQSTIDNKDVKTRNENGPNPPSASVSQDQSRSVRNKRERPLVEKHTTSLQREVTPGAHKGEPQGKTASPPLAEEDFSLMVDADTFQYLQKYCREDYYQILERHRVAVMDYTHEGLTTLLLQDASSDSVDDQERLRKAKKEIIRLLEGNQANICRDKLPKSLLPKRVDLKRLMDKLSSKFARLLFSEDEQNIEFIGNREDVAEAKSFLILYDLSEEEKTEVTSPRRFQEPWPGSEVKPPIVNSLDTNGLDKEEDEAKGEGSPRFKLAAQFKDSRLAPIGRKTSDFTVRGHTQSTNKRQGPMPAYDVLSETSKNAYTTAHDTSADAGLSDTRPKTSSAIPDQSNRVEPQLQNKAGSNLRRTSSFSGTTQKKDQEISPKRDTEGGGGRGRSSSFSSGEIAEVTVSKIEWLYIKKAFDPRVKELTSGVQLRERIPEGDSNMTIILTGANGPKVLACQQGLQNLIDTVHVDFTCNCLSLRKLGVADPTDGALQACCDEIRSRYKKVSMEIIDKSLYLMGPEIICSQVSALLREVFSGASVLSGHQNHSRPSMSSASDSLENSPNGHNGKTNDSSRVGSPRKDAVIKEKVKRPAGLEMVGQHAQDSTMNANGSVTFRNDKTKSNRQKTAVECLVCVSCGIAKESVKMTKCELTICPTCASYLHVACRTCEAEERKAWGLKGTMTYANLPMSLPGYIKHPVVQITYSIPDGIQGESDQFPGQPFKGGKFEAFLPDCEATRKLLPRLQEAFNRGHTFAVIGGRVQWASIPHMTSLQDGKAASGYSDLTYLSLMSEVLTSLGIPQSPITTS